MTFEVDSFITTDGTAIHTRRWPANSTDTTKGVILLVHGIGEHIGRYAHVADALSEAGYVVYGHDHRGHGNSDGLRVHATGFTQFIDDLKQHYDRIQANHPQDTLMMLGHSMGSVVSLQFTLAYPDALDALVVTGTAIDVASTVSPVTRFVGNLLYHLVPSAPISPPVDPDTLTDDPAMKQKWHDDKLIFKGWTRISLGKYILDTGEMIQAHASEITLPLLIMHGGSDRLTPISGSHILYEKAGSDDKTLKIWEGMKHEIFNERDREQVISHLIEWLNQQVDD
jgi:alpha-beta hydrolase superfamily lysophospholipase